MIPEYILKIRDALYNTSALQDKPHSKEILAWTKKFEHEGKEDLRYDEEDVLQASVEILVSRIIPMANAPARCRKYELFAHYAHGSRLKRHHRLYLAQRRFHPEDQTLPIFKRYRYAAQTLRVSTERARFKREFELITRAGAED